MASKKPAATGTAVATRSNTGMVSVQEMMKAQLAKLKDKTAPSSGNTIRVTQDKQFILPDGSTTPGPLQVIVLDFNTQHTFYAGRFVKGQPNPPICFAISDVARGLTPSPNAPQPQSDSCDTCPMNEYGSGDDGKSKACKNARVLAVLPPDADESTPVWLLRTSPTAIKAWDAYAKGVDRMFGVPPAGVITSVGFDENQTYATLTFSDAQPHENVVAVSKAKMDEAQELLFQEPDTTERAPAKAAPRPAVKAAPRRPAVAGARR